MAIQSIDNLITAFSAGQTNHYEYNKITGAAAYTAGRSYSMFELSGSPVATTWPGAALAHVATAETTGDGTNIFGIPNGGNVSTLIKHVNLISAMSTAATGVPSILTLVDLQGYWPGIDMNVNTVQNLTGTPTLRYTNGAGCRLALVAKATTGATPHNINVSYTNTAGTTGRTLPGTVACTVSAIVPHIVHSGVAANNYGPALPLASGDTGVKQVASVTLSAASGTASTAALLLYRPLATINLQVVSLQTQLELVNNVPSLPQVVDGACLGFILTAGAATAASTSFFGAVDTVWG